MEVKKKMTIEEYLLDCIRDCSYIVDGDEVCNDDKSLVQMFFKYYEEEFNLYKTHEWPINGWQIGSYLSGLPGSIAIDYDNEAIRKLSEQIEYEDKKYFCENFFSLCGQVLAGMRRKYDA